MTDDDDDPHDAALGCTSETASDYDKEFDVAAWAAEAEEEIDWKDTDLWEGIQDARNDRFARLDREFEF